MEISRTECVVTLTTPDGQTYRFSSAPGTQGDLLAVETQKDLNAACGSFTLHFAPRVVNGQTWAERLPLRSLVRITMARPGYGPDVDPHVMVGLTDDHSLTEGWQAPQPRRQVTISGREMSAVLVDAFMWFQPNPDIPLTPSIGAAEQLLAQQIGFGWDPNLAQALQDPRTILENVLTYFLFEGTRTDSTAQPVTPRLPLVAMQFQQTTLRDLLRINQETWSTFDQVILPIANNAAFSRSLWNYLHIFIDSHFQEFFSRVEGQVCKLFFRGKPFLHTPVERGTRFKSSDEEPTLQTLALPQSWIGQRQLARHSQAIYNLFWVAPLGVSLMYDKPAYKYLYAPEVIQGAREPSSVERWGIRLMEVESPYLAAFDDVGSQQGKPQAATPTGQPQALHTRTKDHLNPTQQGFATMAEQAARVAGIPDSLLAPFLGLLQAENQFRALGFSSAGAAGIAQFIPSTAQAYGLTVNAVQDDRLNPALALPAAARYWQDLSRQFGGKPDLIIAAYNAGPGAVVRAGYQVPNITETQNHVKKSLGYAKNFRISPASSAPIALHDPGLENAQEVGTGATPVVTTNRTTVIESAKKWAGILRAWYGVGGELLAGQLTVVGHPQWQVGHRLVITGGPVELEFYLEGVSHRFDCVTGHFASTLRVTRGWAFNQTRTLEPIT